MTKVAIYINHPSQFYFFKLLVNSLKNRNIDSNIFIRDKEMLESLLNKSGIAYKSISKKKSSKNLPELIGSVLKKNISLIRELRRYKPDFLISCGSDVAQVGFLLGIPRFVLNDDDAKVVPFSALFGWPFATRIFAPKACNMGFWKRKTFAYQGYFKSGYLHPRYFKPDQNVLRKYELQDRKYFIIRSVSLTAHHDRKIRGLNNELVAKLITELSTKGDVFISSERELPENLNKYRLNIDPLDIHHVLYFASLLISDSQSMTHEAGLLGTPSVRFNDFYNRIGVLNELESKYKQTYGISPEMPDLLMGKVRSLSNMLEKNLFQEQALEIMSKVIDLPEFLAWYIADYPSSKAMINSNPDYQLNFLFNLFK